MHEHVFAGLRGDEAKALLGVEPFYGSNRHVLVPPSIVSEVSTHADVNSNADGKGQAQPAVAKQNVNLCLAHGSGCGHCPLPNPRLRDAAQRALAALEPPIPALLLVLVCCPGRISRWRDGRGDRFCGYRWITVQVRVRVTPSTAWIREATSRPSCRLRRDAFTLPRATSMRVPKRTSRARREVELASVRDCSQERLSGRGRPRSGPAVLMEDRTVQVMASSRSSSASSRISASG